MTFSYFPWLRVYNVLIAPSCMSSPDTVSRTQFRGSHRIKLLAPERAKVVELRKIYVFSIYFYCVESVDEQMTLSIMHSSVV